MFDAPACPNCGSRYPVRRLRTHGYPRTEDGTAARYYRRFSKFSGDDVAVEE